MKTLFCALAVAITLGFLSPDAGAQTAPDVPATRAAAKQGDAQAQYRLGEMYDLGQGVTQDYKLAAQWYRRAAQQGHAQAQFALAEMYKNGDGVAKDMKEAVRWYQRAAKQGNPGAQLLLGVLYESGVGVPADPATAAKWYRKSADQGDARAMLLLGNFYQLGQGVPRSKVAAYALYSVSAAVAASPNNPSLNHRAQMERGMRAEEVEAAKGLAAAMSRPDNFSRALDEYLKGTAKQ